MQKSGAKKVQSHCPPENSLVGFVLIILAAQFIASAFQSPFTWAISIWGAFGLPLAAAVLGLLLVINIPPIARKLGLSLYTQGEKLAEISGRIDNRIRVVVWLAVLMSILYLARCTALAYGDGFQRLSIAADEPAPIYRGQLLLQMQSVWLYRVCTQWLTNSIGMKALEAFALVSSAGGVVGLAALYQISSLIAGKGQSRGFYLLGALTSGSIILFFGYVEYYTWATSMALWSLVWLLRHVRLGASPWPAIVFAVFATALHSMPLLYHI